MIAIGFSCKHQIAHGNGRAASHLALLLREALDRGEIDAGENARQPSCVSGR